VFFKGRGLKSDRAKILLLILIFAVAYIVLTVLSV